MSDVTMRLNALKARIDQGKTERARAQATLEAQEARKREIEAEIRSLGVDPEKIDQEIDRLTEEVAEKLARAEKLVPAGFRG